MKAAFKTNRLIKAKCGCILPGRKLAIHSSGRCWDCQAERHARNINELNASLAMAGAP